MDGLKYDQAKARQVSALLELGQDLHLTAEARNLGGEASGEFINELLSKPTRARTRAALVDEDERINMSDEDLEARALAVYEDYSTLVALIVKYESFVDDMHAKHLPVQMLQRALSGDREQKVLCMMCVGVLAKHLISSGVAVAPW